MSLPRQLYRAADVRELDRRAIEQLHIPDEELMERAGAALYRVLRARLPAAGRVLVLCGGGNNGGDGYVVARLAREAGLDVTLAAVVGAGAVRGAARSAMRRFTAAGGVCEAFSTEMPGQAEAIIDALLGTGLDRPVSGEAAEVIRAVNTSGKPAIAADLPSGLHADSGDVLGTAVRARYTVSFMGLKAGLFTGRGPAFAGEVLFDDLGVPAETADGLSPLAWRLDPEDLSGWLAPRERDAHKGDFGHVVMLGGGTGMAGAIQLAGHAALRAGAGRVTAVVWPGNISAVTGQRPELMCRGVNDGADAEPLFRKASVLAAGPGFGQDEWSARLWEFFRQRDNAGLSRVLDADGLNWLIRRPLVLTPDDIITPHPGEAARLLDCGVADIESNRFTAVRELAAKFDCVAVLKGAGTLIGAPDGRIALCDRGNPGMASAGMGDVLTGLVAGLRAQGASAFDAACAGVLIHALAGDRAALDGERGLLATDLLEHVRDVVNPHAGSRTT